MALGDGSHKALVVCLGQIRMVDRLLKNALGKTLRFIDMDSNGTAVAASGMGLRQRPAAELAVILEAIGIQLGHAGRKGSQKKPTDGRGSIPPGAGDWQTDAPSALAFIPEWQTPQALDRAGMDRIVGAFARSMICVPKKKA